MYQNNYKQKRLAYPFNLQASKIKLENFGQVLHRAIAVSKYNNIVIMGDLNVNTLEHSLSLDKLNELFDTLELYNLIKVSTYKMKRSSTSINLILTVGIISNTHMRLKLA